MSGMSLMHTFSGGDISANPDMASTIDDVTRGSHHDSGGDSVRSQRSVTASPLSTGNAPKGVSRPPGLGVSVPATIGQPGHSYNSSASTSHTQGLTLTPTSSLDGGSDLYSMGRQSSPFHGDGPSLSSEYSRRGKDDGSDFPTGISNIGSFDAEDGEHDGLLGLQALRDRAHSSPGPVNASYSTSPPVRGQIGGFDESRSNAMPEPRRPRAVSKDSGRPTSRPPLAGGPILSPHVTESRSYQGDRSLNSMGVPFSSNRSREPSPPPDMRALGIISRPGYNEGSERMFDPSLRRSVSTDTGREVANHSFAMHSPEGDRNHQQSIDQLSLKFGQLPALSGHPDYQKMQSQPPPPFQRHQRSLSQPGPPRGSYSQPDHYHHEVSHRRISDYGVDMSANRLPPGMESDYVDSRYLPQHGHHSRPTGDSHMGHGRSNSYGRMPAGTIEGSNRKNSLQVVPGSGSGLYGHGHHLPRREPLDFVPGHNRYPESVPVVASSEEMRMYANDVGVSNPGYHRHVSPAHSPLHANYGSHSRHPSDMGSSAMSSSPISMGSGGVRAVPGQTYDMYSGASRGAHHRVSNSDEDLSHPLLGEHIDVPGDDRSYMSNDRMAPQPHSRSSMGHGSIEHIPQYGGAEAAHHPPTAGSALPAPKVVYNVKFKRTQRTFALGPRLNRDLKVGTYVKVEADRGEDLGIVIGKVPSEKFNTSSRSSYRGGGMGEMGMIPPPPGGMGGSGTSDLKRIIRLATHDEVSLLSIKREEEDELLKICCTKVRQRGLPMNVVDAEYQFDRHKLTFFFEAEGRVDFRELVRDLFSIYKTRIWMQQLDKSASAACPAANPQTQPVVMDYGTPIIAPESEYQEYSASGETSTH